MKANIFIFLSLLHLSCCSHAPVSTPPKTVENLNVQKYMGLWHQIGAIPAWFQKDCVSETKAFYELQTDETISVKNSCKQSDGNEKVANGKARKNTKFNESSKLEVTFVNLFGFWVWWFGGDYWVLDLGKDYEYSVVGDPNREFLWILARNDVLSEELLSRLEIIIRSKHYDTCKVIITQNDGLNGKALCTLAKDN